MKSKVVDRVDHILSLCRERRVLHVGCASQPFTQRMLDDGTCLHSRVEKVAALQYGIDLSREGIELLRARGYRNVAVADAEQLGTQNPCPDIKFDIILAGELLEHLSNPGLFLDAARALLSEPSSRLVLSTPNAYCGYRFLYTLLTRREGVNPDHVAYFSRSTLTTLLTRHGYEIEDLCYCPLGAEFEQDLNRGWGRILWWTDRLASRLHPTLSDGLVVTCRPVRPVNQQ